MNKWTITKDKFLDYGEVKKLYIKLADSRDIAIQRKKGYVYIRDYFILRTLLETGVRVAELVDIKVKDLVGNSLIIQNGKGGKKRGIILTSSTKRIIKDFLKVKETTLSETVAPEDHLFISERNTPYTTRGIRKRVKYWFNEMGFNPSLSVHSCRHTYISHLLASGKVDLATIRNNAGHSSIAVTDIYSHAVKDSIDIDLYK